MLKFADDENALSVAETQESLLDDRGVLLRVIAENNMDARWGGGVLAILEHFCRPLKHESSYSRRSGMLKEVLDMPRDGSAAYRELWECLALSCCT